MSKYDELTGAFKERNQRDHELTRRYEAFGKQLTGAIKTRWEIPEKTFLFVPAKEGNNHVGAFLSDNWFHVRWELDLTPGFDPHRVYPFHLNFRWSGDDGAWQVRI